MMTRYYLIKKTISLMDFPPFSILLRILYKISFSAACLFLRQGNHNLEVWPRNSYKSKALKPGWSDIDLTIFAPSEDAALRVLKRWRLVHLINPLFHEVNLYIKDEIHEFTPFANYFEATRDPILYHQLSNFPAKDDLEAQAITYLLRQLHSDFKNLENNESIRKSKWAKIFHDINIVASIEIPKSYESIQETIKNIIASWSPEDSNYNIVLQLHRFFTGHSHKQLKNDHLFQSFYPHLWVSSAIKYYSPSQCCILKPADDYKLQRILIAQINWEIWGLYSQRHLISDKKSITNHLQYMKNILEHLSPSGSLILQQKRTLQGVEKLIQLIEQ